MVEGEAYPKRLPALAPESLESRKKITSKFNVIKYGFNLTIFGWAGNFVGGCSLSYLNSKNRRINET